ncbi:MAG: DUF262 domain-containing protein [Okeania sp. SIO2C2]|uniref:DUF262 domain-containing protein n=1 Tax=Okeania sp. SIO2C2 TaxID=2607787 RepID=UPI0013BD3DF9|nr:DUF262 domain-containing protein [Okeania sp. SIO2C2]NEP89581.1 DUF262 domain-containing protein [Okeania sp. SIO2C2]
MPPKSKVTNSKLKITNAQKEAAEAEIREKQKAVDYRTTEYPVEVIVQKYMEGEENDTNELFVPDYQREMVWDDERQSKFIESVFLGLPIPPIFVAGINDEENEEDEARLEIIDGTQRIRTLTRFIKNELTLCELKKLSQLNNFKFEDLPLPRQRRFNRATVRIIELTEKADEETRRDVFERINTGSVQLNEMEKRRGIYPGKVTNLIEELSKLPKFRNLCSFSQAAIKQRDPQEFVLRFFAFLNKYKNFNSQLGVINFLDEYLKNANDDKNIDLEKMRHEFEAMINFVKENFPDGFRSGKKLNQTTTRIKFESLSVGVALALREKNNLHYQGDDLLNSPKSNFQNYTKGDASSSNKKVIRRIEYVRDKLLGK